MISKETIERVKNEARLVDIVPEVTALKRKGAYQVGLCPFHSEQSPSFFVRDQLNTYTCFGCGESGNVISFVMATKALPFPEAVEYLADKCGIPLVRDQREQKPEDLQKNKNREEVLRALQLAQKFFRTTLFGLTDDSGESRAVKNYLAKRKLTREAVEEFQIGYSATSLTGLIEYLRRQKIAEEVVVEAGLARRSHSGQLFDIFRGRLIFPVYLDKNTVIGFGGRLVPGVVSEERAKEMPKYLNSPESVVYHKAKTLFGLNNAMPHIREDHEVYVVEGYMDVIGLWQAGVKNAVAACGTAISEYHFRRLGGVAGKIHLLLDGDDAGRAAAGRSFESSLNCDADTDVVFLPDGKDPDDLAKEAGASDCKKTIEALPRAQPVDVFVDLVLAQNGCAAGTRPGPNVLGRVSDVVLQSLKKVRRRIARDEFAKAVTRKLGIELSIFESLLDEAYEGASTSSVQTKTFHINEEKSENHQDNFEIRDVFALPAIDRELLRVVALTRGQGALKILSDPGVSEVVSPEALRFFSEMRVALGENNEEARAALVRNLLHTFGNSWIAFWKDAYQMLKFEEIDGDKALEHVLRSLKRERFQRNIVKLEVEVRNLPEDSGEKAVRANQVIGLRRQLGAV